MILLKLEDEIYNKTLKFLGPLGSLDYKGLEWPKDTVTNPKGLHNMFENGDQTFHTGVLLRALAWRYKTFSNTKKQIIKILNHFLLSQNHNSGCLVRHWVREEGYEQFLSINKNGNVSANWFGECEPEGSHRYRKVIYENQTYYVRYDISIDAIVSVATGLYWAWKFGDQEIKDLTILIAKNQLDFYKKNNWTIRDDQGNILRYGRHWKWNLVCNINSKILNFLATGKKESHITDIFLNHFKSRIPFQPLSETNQFNNYMFMSCLAVIRDIGWNVDTSISNLCKETIQEENYLNNKIFNWVFNTDALPVIFILPQTNYINVTYIPSVTPVPHGQRHNALNVWEVTAYRLAIGDVNDRKYELPQAWWLELYWCYWCYK